jgi:hypothetical protein
MVDWEGSVEFSQEDPPLFRWQLDRWWAPGPRALVCMANPSYAGGDRNDPTITNLIKLIHALGYPGFTVVNWSPYIATSPKDLHAWRKVEGVIPEEATNAVRIYTLSKHAAVRVVAWGNIVPTKPDLNTRRVLNAMFLDGKESLHVFGFTNGGAPKHPMARGRHRLTPGASLERWVIL